MNLNSYTEKELSDIRSTYCSDIGYHFSMGNAEAAFATMDIINQIDDEIVNRFITTIKGE